MSNSKKGANHYYPFILLPGLLGIILFLLFSETFFVHARPPQPSTSVPNQGSLSEKIIQIIPFKIIEQGQFSKIEQKQNIVVDSQEEWQKLWRQHTAQMSIGSFQGPTIDFTDTTVIGVFLGKHSTGGFSISIQELVETRDEMIVTLVETSPPPDAMVTQALTSPFQIIKVPKISKPVQFNQNASI